MASYGFAGYWREGNRLVLDRNAVLPDRCIKCNEPADGYRKTVKLQYANTGSQLVLGAMAYAFAQRATIEVGLCEQHRRSPAVTIALGSLAILILSFIGMISRGTNPLIPLLAGLAFIGGVVGLVVAYLRTHRIAAAKISNTHLWLKGIGEPFLAAAPPAPAIEPGASLPTIASGLGTQEPAAAADRAYQAVRAGAVTFLIGGLITAGSYLFLSGTYLIAWGPMAFGLYRLIRGARGYLAVPTELRTTGQLLTLGGMLIAGTLAGGWVGIQEVEGNLFVNELDAALVSQTQGATLFADVMNRSGSWTSEDAADMAHVAALYGEAADALTAAHPPASLGWFRDGLVKNFRDATDIANGFAHMGATSTQGSADALVNRWLTRVRELNDLQARLEKQVNP